MESAPSTSLKVVFCFQSEPNIPEGPEYEKILNKKITMISLDEHYQKIPLYIIFMLCMLPSANMLILKPIYLPV